MALDNLTVTLYKKNDLRIESKPLPVPKVWLFDIIVGECYLQKIEVCNY